MCEKVDWDLDMEYDEQSIEDCKMTVQEFKEACEHGAFIDYDGYCDVYGEFDENGQPIHYGQFSPSERNAIPEKATYVIWYNR